MNGRERGDERFTITEHADGTRTLRATCEGHTRAEGRIHQRLALARRAPAFGAHPIQSDAWLTRLVPDRPSDSPAPRQTGILLPSVDHRGATGPMLTTHPGVTIQFVGRESVEVPAGRFDALHYRFIEASEDEATSQNAPGQHPPYDLWCTADEHRILLRSIATGYMQTQYELASLEISPA